MPFRLAVPVPFLNQSSFTFRHCSVTVPTPFFTQLRLWQAVCIWVQSTNTCVRRANPDALHAHLPFTNYQTSRSDVTDSGRQSILSKFKACLWFKVMYQLIMERYWTEGLMEWRKPCTTGGPPDWMTGEHMIAHQQKCTVVILTYHRAPKSALHEI